MSHDTTLMAAKHLRDVALYADESLVDQFKGGFVQRFHRQSCCISERYRSLLAGRLRTNGTVKIFIKFMSRFCDPVVSYPSGTVIDVWCCQWPFNFEEYQSTDVFSKKKLIEGSLYECLLEIAREAKWNVSLIDDAHQEIVSNNYSFTGTSKASWLAPGSKHRARVAFDWDLDEISLFAVLFRNRSSVEVSRKKLGWLPPEAGILNEALLPQHGRWLSQTEFELKTTDFLRKQWTVSFAEEIA